MKPATARVIVAAPATGGGRSFTRSLAAGAIAFSLALAGCAGRNEAPVLTGVPHRIEEWSFDSAPGHVIRTPHYEIHTTLRETTLVNSLPQALEMACTHYRRLAPAAAEPTTPMPVYLFARRGQWETFTRRLAGARAATLLKVRNGGYTERGVAVIEYVTHATTFPILAHEGFHQYLYHSGVSEIPAWLNEGLATLCEGQRWGPQGLVAFDPWLNPNRRNPLADALRRDQLIPLAELLRINAAHVVGESNRKIQAYYGQLWALLLFLREGEEGKYAAGFDRLLAALGAQDLRKYAEAAHVGSTEGQYDFGVELFRAFVSTDLDAFEQEYRRFLRRNVLGER